MRKKTLPKLLQEAKELNIPYRNCMKTKQELEKAIIETQRTYKYIIFGNDTPTCAECLNELQK